MIQMPQRSVTRFFIPLIDVLTLLFCIYLLMPIVKPVGEEDGESGPDSGPASALTPAERQELARLRRREQLLQEEIARLHRERSEALQQQLVTRLLQIDDRGRLFFHDPQKPQDVPLQLTAANVRGWLERQREQAAGKELYLLILYPPVPPGSAPTAPSEAQKEDFERWFRGVAHGYNFPVQPRGG